MDNAQLEAEVARLTDERDEARSEAASAGIDAEEMSSLRESHATAEETLAAVEKRLAESESARAESESARALTTFTTKRDNAIKEVGLPKDHPAIPLAFPDDTVLDDGAFASALESLTKIAALSVAPVPPEEIDPKPGAWDEFRGVRSGDGPPPSEATQAEKQTVAARAKYTETRNLRDLVGGLGNVIMRIVSRKTPGGQTYYEKERVE